MRSIEKLFLAAVAFMAVIGNAMAAELVVIKAEYGIGDQWKDVTDKVKEMLAAGNEVVPVETATFGDPAPWKAKTLKVRIKYNNKVLTFKAQEKNAIDLSETRVAEVASVEIISAKYGAKDKWNDVTAKVSVLVKEDREIAVEDSNFGDPLRGVPKQLKVKYKVNGKEMEKSADQKGVMTLP